MDTFFIAFGLAIMLFWGFTTILERLETIIKILEDGPRSEDKGSK